MTDETPAVPPADAPQTETEQRQWQPLSAVQRRVAGVLVEKAKTTPDQYPLSLNALVSGCNQKSNRNPQMNLDGDQVEQILEELREIGAVVEIQSGGRVAKYKHRLYEWLGVDKVELAVMAELLLRGEQTVGELRGRAARMETIADLGTLRPILQSLIEKGLVIELTPEGRGQVVSHALFNETRLAELRQQYEQGAAPRAAAASPPRSSATQTAIEQVRQELADMKADLEQLKQIVQQMRDDQ